MKNIILDGHYPRVNQPEVLIGEPINVHYRHTNNHATTRIHKAITLAGRVSNLALTRYRKLAVIVTSVIPRMTYSTLWSMPAAATTNTLRSKIINCIWGVTGSKWKLPDLDGNFQTWELDYGAIFCEESDVEVQSTQFLRVNLNK